MTLEELVTSYEARIKALEARIHGLEDEVELLRMVEAERDAMLREVEHGLRTPWWRIGYRRALMAVWEASESAWRRFASERAIRGVQER